MRQTGSNGQALKSPAKPEPSESRKTIAETEVIYDFKTTRARILAKIGLPSLILLSSCSDVKPSKSALVKPVIQERREVLPPGGCIDNIEALSLTIQHMKLMLSGEKVEADQLAFSFSRESFFGVDYISVAVRSKGRVQIIIDVECTGDSILKVRSPEEAE